MLWRMAGWGCAAAAMLVLTASPETLGKIGTAAYERGKASGVTPQTLGEETLCLVYWDQWHGAIDNDKVSDELLAALPEEVDSAAAFRTSEAWSDRLMDAYQKRDGELNKLLDQVARLRPGVAGKIVAAVDGDETAMAALMEMLGSCGLPGK